MEKKQNKAGTVPHADVILQILPIDKKWSIELPWKKTVACSCRCLFFWSFFNTYPFPPSNWKSIFIRTALNWNTLSVVNESCHACENFRHLSFKHLVNWQCSQLVNQGIWEIVSGHSHPIHKWAIQPIDQRIRFPAFHSQPRGGWERVAWGLVEG